MSCVAALLNIDRGPESTKTINQFVLGGFWFYFSLNVLLQNMDRGDKKFVTPLLNAASLGLTMSKQINYGTASKEV